MSSANEYCVLLLPRRDIAVERCSLGEAEAFLAGYAAASPRTSRLAVIAPLGALERGRVSVQECAPSSKNRELNRRVG